MFDLIFGNVRRALLRNLPPPTPLNEDAAEDMRVGRLYATRGASQLLTVCERGRWWRPPSTPCNRIRRAQWAAKFYLNFPQ